VYYGGIQTAAGPNPFHCHEFEYAEFEAALYAVFPHVRIWTRIGRGHCVRAVAPGAHQPRCRGDPAPEEAHFFVAACSGSAIEANDVYAWMPSTGNLLREREHHISKLEGELAKKDIWLSDVLEQQQRLTAAMNDARGTETAQRMAGG